MLIPDDAQARQTFYQEILRCCLISRQERFALYKQLRNYFLWGSAGAVSVPYNKIASTVETLQSFIYSPESTRFNIHLGTIAPPDEIAKVKPMVAEMNDVWRGTRAHLTFLFGLIWSMVFGCMLFKTLWKGGMPRPYVVEPHQFGVYREDIIDLADQEAFVHCYTTTKSQLEMDLKDNPRKNEIIDRVTKGRGENDSGYSDGMDRLTLGAGVSLTSPATGAGGSVDGGIIGGDRAFYDYAPNVEADLIDMFELYVWNDKIENYQMVTLASGDVIVYDRVQPGVPGVPCFTKLAPQPTLYDYFWGASFVAPLCWLQDWRTEVIEQIRQILQMQADPPAALSGFGGIQEEKLRGMRSAGGQISSTMPGAKYETFAPKMPPNIFAELEQIDKMFDDQAGIGHILQGKGEPGVRSKGQADLMARLGSARPKSRAVIVEEAAEDMATLMMRLVQENSTQRFVIPNTDGKSPTGGHLTFLANQFTSDFEVRVDAHSSSPIFVEDRKVDADKLFEAHAIDRETLLQMYDPPGLQQLLTKLKTIEQREAEQEKAKAAAEQAKGA